ALWIGLNDFDVEGSFRWSSGAPLTYSNWNSGEPGGGTNENAVHLWPPNATFAPGKWNDHDELAIDIGVNSTPVPFHGVVETDPLQVQIRVSHVGISWNSALDINYQVQYVSPLTSNAWTNLGPP